MPQVLFIVFADFLGPKFMASQEMPPSAKCIVEDGDATEVHFDVLGSQYEVHPRKLT